MLWHLATQSKVHLESKLCDVIKGLSFEEVQCRLGRANLNKLPLLKKDQHAIFSAFFVLCINFCQNQQFILRTHTSIASHVPKKI